MKYLYRIRQDRILVEDKYAEVFGIDVYLNAGDKPVHIRSIPDIFASKVKAEQFVEKCNLLQLSPCHLDDVIEDLL